MGSFFKKALGFAAPLAGLAVPGLGGVALGAGLGALGGNGLKGALGGALGAAGTAGFGGTLGNFLGAGTGATGSALGSGILGAAGGALGDGVKGALTGGALGGIGGYVQGSGGLGNAWKNVTGAAGTPSAPAGGLSSSYGLDDIRDLASSDSALAGINPSAGGALGSTGTKSSWLTPALSGGIGAFTNQRAEDQLMEGQQRAFSQLSPFLNSKFDASSLASDPGYQFQLQQGEAALGRNQAARGNYFSGEALREASDFNKGLTDTTLQDAYSRYANDQNRKIGIAGGLADIYSNQGNIGANATTNLGNILTGSLAAATGGNGVNSSGQIINQNGLPQDILLQLRQRGLI